MGILADQHLLAIWDTLTHEERYTLVGLCKRGAAPANQIEEEADALVRHGLAEYIDVTTNRRLRATQLGMSAYASWYATLVA